METRVLEQAGLTEKEASVYLILLEDGPVTAGLVIKRSGLHKATVYTILQRLMERGLVTYIVKGKAKHYSASDPEMLLEMLKEKQRSLEKILPQLKIKKEKSSHKEAAVVYEGLKAVKAALKNHFESVVSDDIHRVFVVSESSINMEIDRFFRRINISRARHGVRAKFLWSQTARRFGEKRAKIPLTEVKFVPEAISTPAVINVHGDISIISMLKARNPICIKVKNREIADSFKKYFDLLWSQDVKIFRGIREVKNIFYELMRGMGKGDEYLVLGATYGEIKEKLSRWFAGYHRDRISRGIKVRMLSVPDIIDEITSDEFRPFDPSMKISRVKPLQGELRSPLQVNIYKNKCAIFLFTKEPAAFVIENREIAENYRKYFEMLWEQETKVLKGYGAVWNTLREIAASKNPCAIGARGYYFDRHKEDLKKLEELLAKAGTTIRNLVDSGAKHPLLSIKGMKTRYLPKEFRNPSVIWLYKNKVSIFHWTEKEPIVIHISNRNVYNAHMKHFEQLWKAAKAIPY